MTRAWPLDENQPASRLGSGDTLVADQDALQLGSLRFQHVFTLSRGVTPAVISGIAVSETWCKRILNNLRMPSAISHQPATTTTITTETHREKKRIIRYDISNLNLPASGRQSVCGGFFSQGHHTCGVSPEGEGGATP